MSTGTLAIVASVGGVSVNQSLQFSGDHPNPYQLPLPIAWTGTIVSGTVTLPAGHAIVTGTVDAYWIDATSGNQYVRYGCSATVTANAVALTGGTGNTLPTSGSVTLGQVVQFATEIYSSGVQFIVVNFDHTVGHALFQEAGGTAVLPLLLPKNTPWFWTNVSGASNPLSNPVGLCQASNGDPTGTAVLTILSMENV